MSRLIALGLLAACNGKDDDDGTIVPIDDADADTDADSDADTDADSDTDTDTDPPALCAPITPPGDAIAVAAGADLAAAIAAAPAGATLTLADGTYTVAGPLRITQPLTLLSASGARDAVTIDGASGDDDTNLLEIASSDVTLAHLTLTGSYDDLVVITPTDADLGGIRLHDVHLLDPGRYAVVVRTDGNGHYVDDGEVSCSSIELSATGRTRVREQCNTGGIDATGARGWTVRDNHIDGFWCGIGTSGPAIRFSGGSRDTVVTRNNLTDVVYGIVLGEGREQSGRTYDDAPCGGVIVQHIDGQVTNNIVAAYALGIGEGTGGVVTGIRAESSCNIRVIHNSVFSSITPGSSIEHRYDTTTGMFANNLVSNAIRKLTDSQGDDVQNLENQPISTWYFPAELDFHTAPAADQAIDQGSPDFLGEVPVDIDNQPRADGLPDVGADELP